MTEDPAAPGPAGPPEPPEAARARREALVEAFRAREFFARLEATAPRPWATWVVIGANLLVFAAMLLSGVSLTDPTASDVFRWGGDFRPATEVEPWRLVTACFVHVGLIHVFVNMYCLWVLGPVVERAVGHSGYLATHLAAGVAGNLASHAFGAPAVSAGASGSVFGLLGLLLAYALRIPRDEMPRSARSAILRTGLVNVGINLAVGLSLPMVNNAAHVGGLVGGFGMGLVLARPPTPADVARRPARALAAGIGAAAVLAALAWALWASGWRSPWPSYERYR
jgi:rhomboid protease GluP